MLKPKAWGLATGILWAVFVAWSVFVGLMGEGSTPYGLLSAFYLGWFGLSWAGMFIGAILAFIDGLICGAIFAWLYNKFAS